MSHKPAGASRSPKSTGTVSDELKRLATVNELQCRLQSAKILGQGSR